MLSYLLSALIIFVIANLAMFSRRYLQGDRFYRQHTALVIVLMGTVLAMVSTDSILTLAAGWTLTNCILVRLMIHKTEWKAARASGLLALKTLGFGSLALIGALCSLGTRYGTTSIAAINQHVPGNIALVLLVLAAMAQSALWPFHRWLTSSLNSPTPVSALMHAGIVNGGGFLLARFAPLFLAEPMSLQVLFLAGLITAVLAGFWKLIQTDIKRMLACSTMAQMGFMVMQCGMGLFAAAISHLIWHGLFKGYLFLASGAAAREKRYQEAFGPQSPISFALACVSGLGGAATFAWLTDARFDGLETDLLMLGVAFMASTQVAVCFWRSISFSACIFASAASILTGALYGVNIRLIENTLTGFHLYQPQPLNAVYVVGFVVLLLQWLATSLSLFERISHKDIWKRAYLWALNASQPHPATVTAGRSSYRF